MTPLQPYTEIEFHGQHSIRIYDHSRVYFGDYYRVRLEVRCEIALPAAAVSPAPAGDAEPESALYSRFLERMAVPSKEVAAVKLELLAEFRRTSLPYLSAPDFPEKLLARTSARQTGMNKRYVASAG